MISTREKFIETLLPQVLVPISEAAPLVGMSYQSARHHLCRGTFPVQTQRQGRLWFVHIDDLANYLFSELPSLSRPQGKRGRPTKREQIARSGGGLC